MFYIRCYLCTHCCQVLYILFQETVSYIFNFSKHIHELELYKNLFASLITFYFPLLTYYKSLLSFLSKVKISGSS